MDINEVLNQNDNNKKLEMLKDIVLKDNIYLSKILLLLNCEQSSETEEMLNRLRNSKREECELISKICNFEVNPYISMFDIRDITKDRNTKAAMQSIMDKEFNKNYKKAFTEILEIFKRIPTYYIDKINKELLDMIRKNCDKEYKFEIEKASNFTNMNILEETKDILALINEKYWLDNEEEIQVNEIFNKPKSRDIQIEVKNNKELIKLETLAWYKKIVRKLFNKKY